MKPITKNLLGAALIILPFASLFAVSVIDQGAPFAVMVFALTYAVIAALGFGAWLLTE